jgi:hypothetical protein
MKTNSSEQITANVKKVILAYNLCKTYWLRIQEWMNLFYFVTRLFILIWIPGIRARTKYY